MKKDGFTLLEVIVAVAILAIALTAIFSSEAGSIQVAHRARKITVASLLARCKMGELEEQITREGLPAIELTGSDECCEDAEQPGFTCDYLVERIVLPDLAPQEEDEEAATNAAGLNKSATGDQANAEPPSLDEMLASTAGSGDGLAQMAMSYAFPILKPAIEEQVRRATVTVRWHEGTRERSFDVVQYLVAEQPPAATTTPEGDQGGTDGEGGTGF